MMKQNLTCDRGGFQGLVSPESGAPIPTKSVRMQDDIQSSVGSLELETMRRARPVEYSEIFCGGRRGNGQEWMEDGGSGLVGLVRVSGTRSGSRPGARLA